MNLTLNKRTARLEAGHGSFDSSGRDARVVAVLRYVAECDGTPFEMDCVPVGFTLADFYSSIANSPKSRIIPGDPETCEWAKRFAITRASKQ